jgi:hypothetical protein
MKQTAVEWLKLQLEEYGDPQYCELTWKELDELCEQAKEMEKEQIKDAWLNAWKDSMINPLEDKYYEPEAEQYYNETYGKQ